MCYESNNDLHKVVINYSSGYSGHAPIQVSVTANIWTGQPQTASQGWQTFGNVQQPHDSGVHQQLSSSHGTQHQSMAVTGYSPAHVIHAQGQPPTVSRSQSSTQRTQGAARFRSSAGGSGSHHVPSENPTTWAGTYSVAPQSVWQIGQGFPSAGAHLSFGGYQAPVGYASSPQPLASPSFTAATATGVGLTLGVGNPHAGDKRTARASPGNSSSSSSDGVKLFGKKIGHSTSR